MKWFDVLSQYDFEVRHIRRVDNVLAGGLSRQNGSTTFGHMTTEHLTRDKKSPNDEKHKAQIVKAAHLFGHF